MKEIFWIKPIIFTVILLLIACNKEESCPGEIEYKLTHWPVVKTLDITNLASTTATLNGTVNGYGLPTTITFEYDVNTNIYDIPTSYSHSVIASQSPVRDTGIINVSADISGLMPCMIYHFRIKAENSSWINFYGDDEHFYAQTQPTLTTTPASGITATTAIVGGEIIDDGGLPILERGIRLWRPSLAGPGGGKPQRWIIDDSTGVGRFTCNVSGLKTNTLYFYQSYARDCYSNLNAGVQKGLSTGSIMRFTTPQ